MVKNEENQATHHVFNIEIANELGVNQAIILHNLVFWIEKNKENDVNYHDGRYWTYNSVAGFKKIFTYLSESQIRNSLKKLEEKGIIQTGNYNKHKYDRTKWYSLTDKGNAFVKSKNSICQNEQMEVNESGKPIPYINKDRNSDRNTYSYNEEIPTNEIVKYLNEVTDKNYKNTKNTKQLIEDRWNEGYRLNDFKQVIDNMTEEWKYDAKMHKFLRPQTLFSTKFDSYLNWLPTTEVIKGKVGGGVSYEEQAEADRLTTLFEEYAD